MANLVTALSPSFSGVDVLITGHTGFKGSWLTVLLHRLGASVHGVALDPPTDPSHFFAASVRELLTSDHRLDIRETRRVEAVFREIRPKLVLHLAAEAVVRRSYRLPLETFDVNVMGTLSVLEAVRAACASPCAIVVVTSDKVYANDGRTGPYTESDPLGGHDPYSASKAACEIAVASYRASFFPPGGNVVLATARAGNVIGGGDWAEARLVPDAARAFGAGEPVAVRNPDSTRPWQHVLDPLVGYLTLGRALLEAPSPDLCRGWNFGPEADGEWSVARVLDSVCASWPGNRWVDAREAGAPHEAARLALGIDAARERLGWRPRWDTGEAIARTVAWYRGWYADPQAGCQRTLTDVDAYLEQPA